MTTGASMLIWIAAILALAPRLIKAKWPTASPRIALMLWQVVFFSTTQAVILLAVISWHGLFEPLAARLFHARDQQIDQAYGLVHAGGAWAIAVLVSLLVAHVLVAACRETWSLAAARRLHRSGLDVLAQRGPGAYLLLDHATAAIYCVPGRRPYIVVTTAALHYLAPDELQAALTHERAHLRARHHWLHLMARTLRRALPQLTIAAACERAIGMLTEMAADDVAVRHHGAPTTVRALVLISTSNAPPAGALAAASVDVVARVNRLRSRPHISFATRLGIAIGAASLAAAPLVAAAIPGVDAFGAQHLAGRSHPMSKAK